MTTRTKVVLMVLGTVLALTAAMFASPLLGVIGLDKAYAAMNEKPISSEFVCQSSADMNCSRDSGGGPAGSNGSGGSTGGGSTDGGSSESTCVPGVCVHNDGTPDGGTPDNGKPDGSTLQCLPEKKLTCDPGDGRAPNRDDPILYQGKDTDYNDGLIQQREREEYERRIKAWWDYRDMVQEAGAD